MVQILAQSLTTNANQHICIQKYMQFYLYVVKKSQVQKIGFPTFFLGFGCDQKFLVSHTSRYVGPIRSPRLDRSRRYVGPMLALCWPMSALRWPYVGLSWPYLAPMLALCWPKLALSCPYVGPMLAYVGPMLALCWASVTANYVKTPSTCHFFPSGALPERQNHVKRVVF